MEKEREVTKHESFGLIYFSRSTGGNQKFFGSELPQGNYITMYLHNAEIERDLTWDRYYQKEPIVKLRMTANQFAELITSLNVGNGVPCTIERLHGKPVEQLELESRKEFVHRKFKDRMTEFANSLIPKSKELQELLKKPKLSKQDKSSIQWIIDRAIQEIRSNIPFFLECFQEDADKVVTEAKMEVENTIMQKITNAGLEKLFNDQKLLD